MYFKLPFARFVDSLLLRLASKTEMKCNSYNARNAISNVENFVSFSFAKRCKYASEHCCEPTFAGLGFLSVLYFLPVILCPLFPNQITFCFIKILEVFNYLFRISLHASFHGIKFPFQHFFPPPFINTMH